MRLHKISVLNLNSLYGEQLLDLDRDLSGANLFLIHGRTGSGKSTLMDAVALALFGQTPRLDDRRNSPESDPCGIMSRGTGECRATVEFSRLDREGKRLRFEAVWKARRSRNRPDGKFQPVERSLRRRRDDGSWELLVSEKKKSIVDAAFSDALESFTVEDFQRSMLLAQGRFDELLSATPKERGAILERLTDTKEYRKIGEHAAQVASAHRRNLEFLRRDLGATKPVSELLLKETASAVEVATQKLKQSSNAKEKAQTDLSWWQEGLRLRDGLRGLIEERQSLDAERIEAEPELERVRQHEACNDIFERMDRLEALEERLTQSQKHLRTRTESCQIAQEKSQLSNLTSISTQKRTQLMDRTLGKLRKPCVSLEGHIQEDTSKSEDLEKLARRLFDAEREAAQTRSEYGEAEKNTSNEARVFEEAKVTLSTCEKQASLRDAWRRELQELHSGLVSDEKNGREELARLTDKEEDLDHSRGELQKKKVRYQSDEQSQTTDLLKREQDAKNAILALCGNEEATTHLRVLNQLMEQAAPLVVNTQLARNELFEEQERRLERADAETQREDLAKLSSQMRQRGEMFRNAAKIAADRLKDAKKHSSRLRLVGEIATRRDALQKGEDCPLCGSVEHPYIDGTGTCPDERAILQTLKEADSELSQRESELGEAEEEARERERTLSATEADERNATRHCESLHRKGVGKAERLKELRQRAQLKESCDFEQSDRILLERSEKLDETRASWRDLATAQEGQEAAQKALALVHASLLTRKAELNSSDIALAEREKLLQEAQSTHLQRDERRLVDQIALRNKLLALGVSVVIDKNSSDSSPSPDLPLLSWRQQVATVIAPLEHAEEQVSALQTRKNESEVALAKLAAGLKAKEAGYEEVKHNVSTQRRALAVHREKLEEKRAETLALWAERDVEAWDNVGEALQPTPGDFLSILEKQKSDQLKLQTAAIKVAQEAEGELKILEGMVSNLREQATEIEKDRDQENPPLLAELKRLNIATPADALSRKLRPQLLGQMQEKLALLQKQKEELNTREEERELAVQNHEKSVPDGFQFPPESSQTEDAEADETPHEMPWEEKLQATLESVKNAEKIAREESVDRQIALAEIEAQARKVSKAGTLLRHAEEEATIWLDLSKLIGADNGNAFREFAQGLNLHRLIVKANHHLQRLSARYQLTQSKKDGIPTLDFAIVDLWQIGEPRSPRSLSGGERFLVSLALALGLSDLRSHSLPIETLLLDEGFGTLDSETLEIALAALQHLQSDGRQVGVISHVEGLKERIEAKVLIEEMGAGRSRIVVANASPTALSPR